jgi:DNA-binding transcriptional ArsR family regulator
MTQDRCQVTVINQQRIAQARQQMPDELVLAEMAEIFKLLGDLTRVRILRALAVTELCVCDLAALLEMTSSAISHQLRLLRARGIVRFRKEGKVVYYRLDDEHVQTLVDVSLRHAAEC